MNAMTETLQRPRPRLAELDPFEPGGNDAGPDDAAGTEASYGCVDWYAYEAERCGPRRIPGQAPVVDDSLPT